MTELCVLQKPNMILSFEWGRMLSKFWPKSNFNQHLGPLKRLTKIRILITFRNMQNVIIIPTNVTIMLAFCSTQKGVMLPVYAKTFEEQLQVNSKLAYFYFHLTYIWVPNILSDFLHSRDGSSTAMQLHDRAINRAYHAMLPCPWHISVGWEVSFILFGVLHCSHSMDYVYGVPQQFK